MLKPIENWETECRPYPCMICKKPIETCELCEDCAEGNDPFFVCDNSGRDLKGPFT